MSEQHIQNQILLALSEAGCTVWRQNTGLAWVGTPIQLSNGDVLLKNPRRLHVGLCKGSSDIIGMAPCGRMLAVEVKTQYGKPTQDQLNFISQVNSKGGIAAIARTVDQALRLVDT